MLLATAIGPVAINPADVLTTLLSHVPLLDVHSSAAPVYQDIIWQIRLPRVILSALVGAMLAAGGASYQGVLRNSLADPYLLGVAAGAGLGATAVIVAGKSGSLWLPAAAFAGAVARSRPDLRRGRGRRRAGRAGTRSSWPAWPSRRC